MIGQSALSHCVTLECAASAERAFEFLADGLAVGRWALGCFATMAAGDGLYRGTSLFDDRTLYVKPVGDRARLMVEYHVGEAPDRLAPRIVASCVPGPAVGRAPDVCLVSLIAWRDAAMSEERWRRLVATHEAEIWLIKHQLEPG